MKNILITGAFGYIGTYIRKELKNQKIFNITSVDYKSHASEPNENIITQDILKNASDESLYEKLNKPDIVLHLAWKDGFNHNANSHMEDLSSHFAFLKNMIDHGVKQIVVAGSFREYGSCHEKTKGISENHECVGGNFYSLAKLTLKKALEIYVQDKDVTLQWLRFFTPYGHDELNNSILSKILIWEKEGKATFPFTDGEEQYDYIHVEEIALQVAAVLQQTEIDGAINICSGKPTKLKDVIENFLKENNLKIKPEYGAFKKRSYDSDIIFGDNTKIQTIIKRNK